MAAALRIVLFWWVMLALPLHGIAATALMPVHGAGHGAAPMQMHAAADTTVGIDAAAVPGGSMPDCADLLGDCAHLHLKGSMKCGLSAACALVAAPALQIPSVLAVAAQCSPLVRPSHERIAFLTGAPERPPRSRA